MKKVLLMSMMVLILGACTSTKTDDTTRLNRHTENWVDHAGDAGTEYWWVQGYLEDSDD